ncbi:unnamed protein product, partial [Amoebophrya sp. A25]
RRHKDYVLIDSSRHKKVTELRNRLQGYREALIHLRNLTKALCANIAREPPTLLQGKQNEEGQVKSYQHVLAADGEDVSVPCAVTSPSKGVHDNYVKACNLPLLKHLSGSAVGDPQLHRLTP